MRYERELIACSKEEETGPNQRSGYYHRVQADKSALEESPDGHSVPSVIISIADNKTR
jgi:hypothetical protein